MVALLVVVLLLHLVVAADPHLQLGELVAGGGIHLGQAKVQLRLGLLLIGLLRLLQSLPLATRRIGQLLGRRLDLHRRVVVVEAMLVVVVMVQRLAALAVRRHSSGAGRGGGYLTGQRVQRTQHLGTRTPPLKGGQWRRSLLIGSTRAYPAWNNFAVTSFLGASFSRCLGFFLNLFLTLYVLLTIAYNLPEGEVGRRIAMD